jgi:hypothetical protein
MCLALKKIGLKEGKALFTIPSVFHFQTECLSDIEF